VQSAISCRHQQQHDGSQTEIISPLAGTPFCFIHKNVLVNDAAGPSWSSAEYTNNGNCRLQKWAGFLASKELLLKQP
jgi:hypothetical protein